MSSPNPRTVTAQVDLIESEMRRIGMWQTTPLPPEKLTVTTAFGQGSIAFEQWLQFIFLPRVREIIATHGQFPTQSQVADQAFREWRMWGDTPDTDHLLSLLRAFDQMFH